MNSPLFFAILAFGAAALAIVGIYSFLADILLRDRSRVGRRVDEEFRTRQRERMRRTALFKDFAQLAAEAAGEEWSLTWRRRFEMLVEQSGIDVTPGRILGIAAGLGLGFGLIGTLLRGSAVVGIALAVIAGSLPILYVWIRRQRRRAKLQVQLPPAFELMARVIRAGQTMTQALQAVADDFDKPISAEFSYCYEQQNLGLPPEAALRDLARRSGILEVRIFVLAMLIQQQTGGNLAEMLDKLATVMRDRARIQGKIRALTAEGRMQALVLLGLPVFMLLVLTLLNPTYIGVLWQHPNLLMCAVISEALGALWIRKIVNFDF